MGFNIFEAVTIIIDKDLLKAEDKSDDTDDAIAATISFDITQKIQSEMTYPGQVKVTVIRETRAVNVAR